ncbi:MAG: calcium-binding protein [Polaromonas sp.]|nr:calcium-binding protein [Polaromonas sp.]
MAAIEALDAHDALQCKLTLQDWKQVAPYLSLRFLNTGDALMSEGEQSRELYILAEGVLEVRIRHTVVATLKPGTVVGEGTFFSGHTRSATVAAATPGVAWALSWDRFEAMSKDYPRLALDLCRSVAAVMAVRMREAILVGHFA